MTIDRKYHERRRLLAANVLMRHCSYNRWCWCLYIFLLSLSLYMSEGLGSYSWHVRSSFLRLNFDLLATQFFRSFLCTISFPIRSSALHSAFLSWLQLRHCLSCPFYDHLACVNLFRCTQRGWATYVFIPFFFMVSKIWCTIPGLVSTDYQLTAAEWRVGCTWW